jgi:hypothetical protein
MGHNRLSVLPATVRWQRVVGLLDAGASTEYVISATTAAAERDLLTAADDPVYVEAVRLLLTIPFAARADDFGLALREADIPAGDRPEMIDLVIAVSERLDHVGRIAGHGSDFGELAGRALTRTLATEIGEAAVSLFGSTPVDVHRVARKLSSSQGIARFTRSFFGHLLGETLSYWLDRALADHIGPERRFSNATARSAFDADLDQFTAETTRIIQEFSGGWYGKTLSLNGGFGTGDAKLFGAVALKKIVAELRARGFDDG